MCTETILPLHFAPVVNDLDVVGAERICSLHDALAALNDIRDARRTDSRYLDALKEDYQTQFLTGDEPEERKREMIATSLRIHRMRGTRAAIRQAFAAADIGAVIIEDTGVPHVFDVDISMTDRQITPSLRAEVLRFVSRWKNARSHLRELVLAYLARGDIHIDSGAVGEACAAVTPITGYSETLAGSIYLNTGGVGEVSYTARSAA